MMMSEYAKGKTVGRGGEKEISLDLLDCVYMDNVYDEQASSACTCSSFFLAFTLKLKFDVTFVAIERNVTPKRGDGKH